MTSWAKDKTTFNLQSSFGIKFYVENGAHFEGRFDVAQVLEVAAEPEPDPSTGSGPAPVEEVQDENGLADVGGDATQNNSGEGTPLT